MKTTLLVSSTLVLLIAGFNVLQKSQDREDVRAAVLDYVEGIYEAQPERIARSVHPSLAKVGYWRSQEATTYGEGRMTYDQLYKLAGEWSKDAQLPANPPKEIEIYDVLDQTATVKLSAQWGIDYMHLAKIESKWMIMNVLWQSYPPEAN